MSISTVHSAAGLPSKRSGISFLGSLISFIVDRVGDSRPLLVSPTPIAPPRACRGFDRLGTCVLRFEIETQTGEAFEVTGRPLISSEIADEIADGVICHSRPDRPLAEPLAFGHSDSPIMLAAM
jgi:hypothetical protein